MSKNDSQGIIYQARLHWVIFVWPLIFLLGALASFRLTSLPPLLGFVLIAIVLVWGLMLWLTYCFSYLNIKSKRIVMCSGILIRQTLDIPFNKIESIDIRQSILGSILHYGSLLITGTGGTRQYIHMIAKPLTCRRYIEELMGDNAK